MGASHIRRPGGGRKKTAQKDTTLRTDLEALVEPSVAGDPQSPLRWTSKSLRKLAAELQAMGHATSHRMVAELLVEAEYSLQANRKSVEEGKRHPDRDGQFRYINEQVRRFQRIRQPVISVDTKKKELVGDFKNYDMIPAGFGARVTMPPGFSPWARRGGFAEMAASTTCTANPRPSLSAHCAPTLAGFWLTNSPIQHYSKRRASVGAQ